MIALTLISDKFLQFITSHQGRSAERRDGSSHLNAESYLDVAFGPGTPGLPGANGSHHTRTKRMRTSFKHHQLRTMKSYFAINHNPDAKDLKQLSQKTGLPKRVLQGDPVPAGLHGDIPNSLESGPSQVLEGKKDPQLHNLTHFIPLFFLVEKQLLD
ncbi:unnamed protein product [Nezara viridula]|uniref:Homeobox domain-containing protein n=1 Tax=Nezara viridula TaxID=85310 RepID=A0A9P0EBU4_NEZVI|nr:unnamed protein product [Nezara viridula]